MTVHGTAHFVSVMGAIKYYYMQGYARSEREAAAYVDQKISAGEIHIGPPVVPAGEKLVMLDDDCRYGLENTDDWRD
jgi:hypothetical protein